MLRTQLETCPVDLIEESYLAQLGQADGIWADLSRRIPVNLLGRLRECVFMMLKPDALISGRHKILLKGMAAAGWQLIHAQATLTAGERHFEELYQYNLTIRNEQNMMCAWWINARLYTMAPSVVLVYRVPDTASGLSAHQQVKQLKGPSNPFTGAPGQLRWEAGASNIALNLLHSADDPISTAREFLIFGTAAQLTRALQRADVLAETGPDGVEKAVLPETALREQLFLAGSGNRRLDLPSVLAVIKSRLRATEQDDEFQSATWSLYTRYRQLAQSSLDLDVRARWARFCELSAEERMILDRLDGTGDPAGTRGLLRRLATPKGYGFETAEEIRVELQRRKIGLDPWDGLALDTHLYYSQLLP